VLFTTAVDIINTLAAAQSAGRLKREIARYLKPDLLIIDELGYLPIDKLGADLLSRRLIAMSSRGRHNLRLYAGQVDRACLKAALRPNSDFADEGTPASKYRPTP
jgi:IstB-like ATP binding protein